MPSIRLPESIGALTKTSSTTVSLAASRVNVGGLQFVFANPISLSSAVTGVGGFDAAIQAWKRYNVFVVRDSVGLPGLIASLNESLPTGFSSARWVGYLDTGASAQINGASTTQEGTVGQIRTALLTESQFQLENGMGWILADGRNVAGSRFSTLFGANTVPDLRGVALRGKNNGRSDGNQNPDGDLALGLYQADMYASHSHYMSLRVYGVEGSDDGGSRNREITSVGWANTDAAGGNETRMKNVTVNFFVKVN